MHRSGKKECLMESGCGHQSFVQYDAMVFWSFGLLAFCSFLFWADEDDLTFCSLAFSHWTVTRVMALHGSIGCRPQETNPEQAPALPPIRRPNQGGSSTAVWCALAKQWRGSETRKRWDILDCIRSDSQCPNLWCVFFFVKSKISSLLEHLKIAFLLAIDRWLLVWFQ